MVTDERAWWAKLNLPQCSCLAATLACFACFALCQWLNSTAGFPVVGRMSVWVGLIAPDAAFCVSQLAGLVARYFNFLAPAQ